MITKINTLSINVSFDQSLFFLSIAWSNMVSKAAITLSDFEGIEFHNLFVNDRLLNFKKFNSKEMSLLYSCFYKIYTV